MFSDIFLWKFSFLSLLGHLVLYDIKCTAQSVLRVLRMFSLHFLCVTIIVFIACFVGWLLQKTIRKVTVQSGIQLDPRTSCKFL